MTLTKGNKLPITAASPQELRWWPYHSKLRAGAHIALTTTTPWSQKYQIVTWEVHAK